MKILLCGEGRHDVGYFENWSINQQKQVIEPGWLQGLIEKIIDDPIEFVVVPRSRLVSLPSKDPPKGGMPEGHGRKAMVAKYRGSAERCDIVIFMLDADTNVEKEWSKKRDQVLAGFHVIENDIKSIACIPMSASESWLLSDPGAWKSLGLLDEARLPRRPEELWGERTDPNGNHPHRRFKKVCDNAGLPDSRETRVAVMQHSTIASLRAKCPKSFVPFLEDMNP